MLEDAEVRRIAREASGGVQGDIDHVRLSAITLRAAHDTAREAAAQPNGSTVVSIRQYLGAGATRRRPNQSSMPGKPFGERIPAAHRKEFGYGDTLPDKLIRSFESGLEIPDSLVSDAFRLGARTMEIVFMDPGIHAGELREKLAKNPFAAGRDLSDGQVAIFDCVVVQAHAETLAYFEDLHETPAAGDAQLNVIREI